MSVADTTHIQGQFLVSLPSVGDPRFKRAVVYVFSHDEEGAMGFVFNKPTKSLKLGKILDKLSAGASKSPLRNMPLYFGGPVESEQGFILHSKDVLVEQSIDLPNSALAMTQTTNILETCAKGAGPRHIRLLLGYAGWGAGQLEREIRDNAWLVVPYDEALAFDTPADEAYSKSLQSLGVGEVGMMGRGGVA